MAFVLELRRLYFGTKMLQQSKTQIHTPMALPTSHCGTASTRKPKGHHLQEKGVHQV